ncbi:sialic acid-binding Ig-like lectin 10 isoform X2 [Gadus morhua]|uniref:sialic acid-binding Ig-like lectin 10 isoform X2 n=1 Tax=Gadus morhua TaxID=8049 RepID=UPI0011B5BC51|nr:sialic acid-binding Ig-like lectin 10 isoform X2 [Gadus morhua]
MKMNPRTLSVLLLLAGPLGADPDWHVEYPDSFCVVEGSTATIPCSFTHPKVHEKTGAVVERVVWCHSNKYCSIGNVYDSNVRADSRFRYLGDRVRNCTLKIIKTVKRDAARYRFRFETNVDKYTGLRGVRVNVTNGEDVKVRSSVTDHVVKEGGQVTLTCTSACSFHQLDVHWYRKGHALSEKGPALHLSSLTNDDTGNYTCSLDSSRQKTSAPWSLIVVVDEGKHNVTVTDKEKSHRLLTGSVVSVVLAVVLLLLAGLVFAKRRQAQKKASDVIQKLEVDCKQEAVGASEEVSYSTVHFKRNSSRSAPGPEHEIVYSEVVR